VEADLANLLCQTGKRTLRTLGGEIRFDGSREQIPHQVLTNSNGGAGDFAVWNCQENLTLGCHGTRQNLVRACQDAAIHDVVLSMSGGYDAELIEGAANLSGGSDSDWKPVPW